MNRAYQKQVGLLLDVLPEVAKEDCFALHGGTAINLFARNMPRLSVDIDLTYTEIAAREATLVAINEALARIQSRIENLRPSIRVQHKREICKLQIGERGVLIKIEVNMVGRGVISDIARVELCSAAQERYDVYCTVPMVPLGQIYGGKLCAALDRQHPRDLFDVKLLLKTVMESLNESDRKFLIDFNKLEPDWSVYQYQDFPSVKWKMLNLEKFRRNDPDSYEKHLRQLKRQLGLLAY